MGLDELSEEERREYVEIIAHLTPEQRLGATIDLIDYAKSIMEAGIQLRHPQADAREVQARCAAILCGPDVARRLYGIDVTPD